MDIFFNIYSSNFEDAFQTTLKAAEKYGDFIAPSRKFIAKVIDYKVDHFPGLNNILLQISVLTNKLKTYDNFILDLRQYSKNEVDKIVIIK